MTLLNIILEKESINRFGGYGLNIRKSPKRERTIKKERGEQKEKEEKS